LGVRTNSSVSSGKSFIADGRAGAGEATASSSIPAQIAAKRWKSRSQKFVRMGKIRVSRQAAN
jgi:hypothetical protein